MPSSHETFCAARDALLRDREDYEHAYSDFTWPALDEFNWALDWFDASPADNDGRRSGSSRRTGASSASRSPSFGALEPGRQLAAWRWASRRGDRLIVMLGNQVELWETMLAAMKLGAVIIPATTLLGPADLRDRVERGGARHVIVGGADAPKFDAVPATTPGSRSATRRRAGCATPTPTARRPTFDAGRADARRRPAAPLLHLGHDGEAEARRAHARVVSGRPPSTMYWIGLQPGRRPSQHLVAGLGKARVEQRLRALERGGDGARLQLLALRRAARCST